MEDSGDKVIALSGGKDSALAVRRKKPPTLFGLVEGMIDAVEAAEFSIQGKEATFKNLYDKRTTKAPSAAENFAAFVLFRYISPINQDLTQPILIEDVPKMRANLAKLKALLQTYCTHENNVTPFARRIGNDFMIGPFPLEESGKREDPVPEVVVDFAKAMDLYNMQVLLRGLLPYFYGTQKLAIVDSHVNGQYIMRADKRQLLPILAAEGIVEQKGMGGPP